jgi:hypothetical protein
MKSAIVSIATVLMLGGCATPSDSALVFNPAFEHSAFALNGRSPEGPVSFWVRPLQKIQQAGLIIHQCSDIAAKAYSPEDIRAQQLSDTKWVAPLCQL